ncbi:lipocalin family protein [Kosakonia oryziphila]|nr:lipocalin family protein [Kosakonia oryziphila]
MIATRTATLLLFACRSPTPPDGVTVAQNFNTQRFLGRWHEIARLDHHPESVLEKISATYNLRNEAG